jgi:transposase
MHALRLSIKSNFADKVSLVDKHVNFWRIRAVIKTTITLLIVVGFMNTAMNASDIYFTLASMIWLWQGALEKIEF